MNYISVLMAFIVVSILIYVLLKQTSSKHSRDSLVRINGSSYGKGSINTELVINKWSEIKHMQATGASGMKNALIDADKLLDYVMIQKGFEGRTMGERLKSGGKAFGANLNSVWSAHKLRNQIAHEVEHDIVAPQVKKAINDLGDAIRKLGVNL